MLVSRIMPYAGISSNSRTKTNATNSVAFQGKIPRHLPEDFVDLANKVVAKYQELYKPVSEAHWTLGRTKSTAEEKEKALKIIKKGVTLEAPVVLAGKTEICKLDVGNYCRGNELCLRVGEGPTGKKYRVTLDFESGDKVIPRSELRVQGYNPEYDDFTGKFLSVSHDEKLTTMRTILEAFERQ